MRLARATGGVWYRCNGTCFFDHNPIPLGPAAGFSSATFAWDWALQKTVPADATLYVVINSPRTELNFFSEDLYGEPGVADTSTFTLKIGRASAQNLGWGALNPAKLTLVQTSFRCGLNTHLSVLLQAT